jgi:hydroxymethylglutaryl-CoA lyase
MADAAEVFAGISRKSGTRYTALVPNLEGLDRALEANVSEAAVFAAASETFSRKNINQSVAASLETYRAVCDRALSARRRIRAYVSTAFGCPYEGPVAPATVVALSRRLLDLGAFEVAISDTIGVAHPAQVASVLDAVLAEIPAKQVALHFHDTRGMALANVLTALGLGVLTFDASAGGLGGCPFAPGATGNLATEDLVYMLDGLGAVTGVSLGALSAASGFIASRIDHPLASRYAQAAAASGQALGRSSG